MKPKTKSMSKNRLSFFIQFLLMTVTLVSCQKESLINQPASASFNNLRVKTKSEGNKTEHYTYDAQNRVSRIDFTENGNTYYYTYTYQLDKVIEYRSNEPVRAEEEILPDGSIRLNCGSNPRTYTLNTSGYYIGTSTLCEQQLFSYDESGFITEQNYNISHYNRRQELKNDGKNIIISTCKGEAYAGGAFEYNITYKYFDKYNTLANIHFGKQFLGKSSENLLQSVTEKDQTSDYMYEFDAQQRVIKMTVTSGLSQTTSTYTYY